MFISVLQGSTASHTLELLTCLQQATGSVKAAGFVSFLHWVVENDFALSSFGLSGDPFAVSACGSFLERGFVHVQIPSCSGSYSYQLILQAGAL